MENAKFQWIQKDIDMFIENQDGKLVEEVEKGDLEYINSKVKKWGSKIKNGFESKRFREKRRTI